MLKRALLTFVLSFSTALAFFIVWMLLSPVINKQRDSHHKSHIQLDTFYILNGVAIADIRAMERHF